MGEQGKIRGVSRIIAGSNITISPTPYGAGDVTINSTAGGAGILADTTGISISNTTVETNIISVAVAAGQLAATTKVLRCLLLANFEFGVAYTMTIRVYFGATVVMTFALGVGAATTFWMEGWAYSNAGANSDWEALIYTGGSRSAAPVSASVAPTFVAGNAVDIAVDITAAFTFKCTAQMSVANLNNQYNRGAVLIDIE